MFKEEDKFVAGCVEAIMKRDTSKNHILFCTTTDTRQYQTVTDQNVHNLPEFDSNGNYIFYLCFIGEELIEDFHEKADGTDDLAKQWSKKAVKHVINCGINTAEFIHRRKFARRKYIT